jgi:hypothetical protein
MKESGHPKRARPHKFLPLHHNEAMGHTSVQDIKNKPLEWHDLPTPMVVPFKHL